MPDVFDRHTEEQFHVSADELRRLLDEDAERYIVLDAPVRSRETGVALEVDDPAEAISEGGARLETPVETDVERRREFLESEFDTPGQELLTLLEGGASGATLGLSDVLFGDEESALRAQVNPLARGAGEVGGAVVPGLLSGGTGAAGTLARLTPAGRVTRAAERAAASVVERTGLKGVSGGLLRGGVEGALEGGAFGAGQAVSQAALSDDPLTIESIAAHTGLGSVLGAGAGALFRGLHEGTAKALRTKETPLDDLAGNLRSVDDQAQQFTQKTDELIERRAADLAEDLSAQRNVTSEATSEGLGKPSLPEPFARPVPGVSRGRRAFPEVGDDLTEEAVDIAPLRAQARQEVEPLIKQYSKARKALTEELGSDLNVARLISRKPDSAIKILGKLDEYAQSVRQLDELSGGTIGVGEQFSPEVIQSLVARSVPDEAAQGLAQLETADVAEVLGVSGEKLAALGPEAQAVSKLYAASRFVRGQAGARHGKMVRGVLGGLAEATVGVPGGGFLSRASRAITRRGAGFGARKLADVLSMTDSVTAKIGQSVSRWLNKATKRTARGARATAGATGPAILSRVSFGDSDKKEPVLARIDELKKTVTQPEATRARIEAALAPVGMYNVNTAAKLADVLQARGEFLLSKAPRPYTGPILSMAKGERVPSAAEVSRWARYVRAAEDPMTILDDLEAGRLTPEGVETVKALYPTLYQKIQVEIVEQITELRKGLPYQERLQLSLLFDVPVEPSATPAVFATMQKLFQAEAQQQAGPERISGVPDPPAQPTKGQRAGADSLTGS